jgi:hypothetical protein
VKRFCPFTVHSSELILGISNGCRGYNRGIRNRVSTNRRVRNHGYLYPLRVFVSVTADMKSVISCPLSGNGPLHHKEINIQKPIINIKCSVSLLIHAKTIVNWIPTT